MRHISRWERWKLNLLGRLPQNRLSRMVGRLAALHIPKRLRKPIYLGFAKRYGVSLSEIEKPLYAYRSFNEFFTRKLSPGARTLGEGPFISPTDGTISQLGKITDGTLIQAKGKPYHVSELLGDEQVARTFEDGYFLTIYLSPKNYHRIHSPIDGSIEGYVYVPGRLFPVNPPSVATIDKLFAQNERITTLLSGEFGKLALVKVGATCVGSISLSYDTFRSNQGQTAKKTRRFTRALPVQKMDELGIFHMGSTVILLWEKQTFLSLQGMQGEPIWLGENLSI